MGMPLPIQAVPALFCVGRARGNSRRYLALCFIRQLAVEVCPCPAYVERLDWDHVGIADWVRRSTLKISRDAAITTIFAKKISFIFSAECYRISVRLGSNQSARAVPRVYDIATKLNLFASPINYQKNIGHAQDAAWACQCRATWACPPRARPGPQLSTIISGHKLIGLCLGKPTSVTTLPERGPRGAQSGKPA